MEIVKNFKSKDLRTKRMKDRLSCFICSEHELITEKHHLIPLSDIANCFNNNIIEEVINQLIDLCPNCHSYAHKCFYNDVDYTFGEKVNTYKIISEWGKSDKIRERIQILKSKIDEYAINY